jgi:DNA helicase II / ATP-dependent DNA helicase PcrA
MVFSPSPQQQEFFDWVQHGQGSCILRARAGTGKTTTLVQAVELMSGFVFLGAFNKKIADEIAARVVKREGVRVGTMHSAGLGIWKRAGGKFAKVNGSKMRDLFRTKYAGTENRFYESQVLHLVSYAKQAAVNALVPNDVSTWRGFIEHFDVDCVDKDDLIIELAQEMLVASIAQDDQVIDFDDMIYAPLVHKCRAFEHDWVLIDEAQDTNASRRALALLMLKRGGRMVAVGDEHQAIYGFTGADSNALDLIARAVSAISLPLTVTYRCPKSVVAHAQQWVKDITAHETAPEGVVRELTKPLVDEAGSGDAVLCRFNAPIVELAYQFIAKGKPAKVEGRDIGNNLKQVVLRCRGNSYDAVLTKLEKFRDEQVSKYRAKEQESRAVAIEDKVRCCEVLVDRAMQVNPASSDPVGTIIEEIDRIFVDNANGGSTVFSTIHKSKGREWDRVFWIQTGPSKWARKDWELEQEKNLCYVAATRAKRELILA